MTDTLPSLAVIIPLLNEARYLREALDSLLAQEYPGLEVAVYDGGSSDGTVDLLKEYPITVIVEPGLGQMAAINRGWRRTEAELVTWMAGDDRYLPGALRRLASELRQHPEAAFVHAGADLLDGAGRVTGRLWPGDVQFAELAFEFRLVPQTALIRRSALDRAGMFDEARRFAADYDLFLRLAQFYPGRFVPFVAAQYRVHAASEDAQNYPTVAQATLDVVCHCFQRPDLTPHQSSLKSRALAGAHLFAGTAYCLAGNRAQGWRMLWRAARLNWPALFATRRGLGLWARLLAPTRLEPYRLRTALGRRSA
jgi:glycosyltransferase involved in cell wall biosynthesis